MIEPEILLSRAIWFGTRPPAMHQDSFGHFVIGDWNNQRARFNCGCAERRVRVYVSGKSNVIGRVWCEKCTRPTGFVVVPDIAAYHAEHACPACAGRQFSVKSRVIKGPHGEVVPEHFVLKCAREGCNGTTTTLSKAA